MFQSLRSSFRGQKERREDPGHFESDPSASSTTSKYPQLIPTRQKISRNSSRALRDSHIFGNGLGRKETSTGRPGDRQVEGSDGSSRATDSQGGHAAFIASGQSSSQNLLRERGDSISPYKVSSLDPGRSYIITEGDEEEHTHRFATPDSALQVPMVATVKPTSASATPQQAAELSAAETAREPPLPELPPAQQRSHELPELPLPRTGNNEAHPYELHSFAGASDAVDEVPVSTNPEPTRSVPLGNYTAYVPYRAPNTPLDQTSTSVRIVHVEPPPTVLEQSNGYVQQPALYETNQMDRSQLRTSTSTEEEPEENPALYEYLNGYNCTWRSTEYEPPSDPMPQRVPTIPTIMDVPSTRRPEEDASRAHGEQRQTMGLETQVPPMDYENFRAQTIPDLSGRRPEEGISRAPNEQRHNMGLNSHPPLIEFEGYNAPANDGYRAPDYMATRIAGQGNDTPVKRTRPPAQGSMNTSSDVAHLEARIREAMGQYNVPRRPGLDPLSTLLTWVSEALEERERIIESQRNDLMSFSQETDPRKRDVKGLKKEVGKLSKENQSLANYKLKHDDLKREISAAQEKINALAQELVQAKKDKKQARKDLAQAQEEFRTRIIAVSQERNDFVHKLKDTEATLASVSNELGSAQAGVQQYRKQRDECIQENGQLRRKIEHLQQETKRLTAQAQDELLKAAAQHQSELSGLEARHGVHVAELEQQKARELAALDQKMREKDAQLEARDRQIAAQDLRMASYSKPAPGLVISDGDLGARLRDLAMKLDSLADSVPRPQEDMGFAVDAALDPSDFLGRNAARASRVWHKFVRNVCWRVVVRGFFQRQPGFGAFGDHADGYATLVHLYRLFAPNGGQDTGISSTTTTANAIGFPNTRKANDLRASLFEAILKEVTATVTAVKVDGFAASFRNNVRLVAEDLTRSLHQISPPSSSSYSSSTPSSPSLSGSGSGSGSGPNARVVFELCHEFGVLALQMGSQPSLVVLQTCEHGDRVAAGLAFKDDNHYSHSHTYDSGDLSVDIMVQPALKRVGDGGQDLLKEKVLVLGDVVSLKAGY